MQIDLTTQDVTNILTFIDAASIAGKDATTVAQLQQKIKIALDQEKQIEGVIESVEKQDV